MWITFCVKLVQKQVVEFLLETENIIQSNVNKNLNI